MSGLLSFEYGVMGAGKSQKLLNKYYTAPKNRAYLALPGLKLLGDRIESRAGISEKIDFKVPEAVKFFNLDYINDQGIKYLLVDEAQFLTLDEIASLKDLAVYKNVEVYCFGILTDFEGKFFEGSQELIRLSDFVTQKLITCQYCYAWTATMNARLTMNKEVLDLNKGSYIGVCYKCWSEEPWYTKPWDELD